MFYTSQVELPWKVLWIDGEHAKLLLVGPNQHLTSEYGWHSNHSIPNPWDISMAKQCQPGPPVNRKPFNEPNEHIHLTGYNPKLLRKNLDSCIESTWIYIMASLFELFWATDICLHAGNWSNIPDLWICGIDAHRPHSRKSQQYSFRITHCWGWNTTSPPADSMYFTYEAGSICRARSPVDLHSNCIFHSILQCYKSL